MLNKYRDGQPVAFNILKNEIANNQIAHAYLFSSANFNEANAFALSFSKTLFCPNNEMYNDNCDSCNICHRIDDGNYTELKIIEPDGLWIKKEQLIELQESFNLKSLEGDLRIYIIKEADKLNTQAANCILKFLEEPVPNVIAILTTSDIHSVLETIISRCQVIFLRDNNGTINVDDSTTNNSTFLKVAHAMCSGEKSIKAFIEDEKNLTRLEAIVSFIKKYEIVKCDALLEIKKLWFDYFSEKSDFLFAFDVMIFFYKDVLNSKIGRKLEIFDYYDNILNDVASRNEINNILYKIKKISLTREKIKYNVNLNLLMDKLIIEMESGVKL